MMTANVESMSDHGAMKGPRIKRILQQYKESANSSMCGPNAAITNFAIPMVKEALQTNTKVLTNGPNVVTPENTVKSSSPASVEQMTGLLKIIKPSRKRLESSTSNDSQSTAPYISPRLDPATLASKPESEVIYTDLEGEQIAGFAVGGEIRLCLLRILTQVLYDFSRNEISEVCDSLHINLAPCSDAQLKELKGFGVLPSNTLRCGLITKTDSERLCRTLLHQNTSGQAEKPSVIFGSRVLMVAHECFGGCRGVVALDKYTTECAKCVQCSECHEMFAPAQFVAHCHDDPEHRACHWGFNPANWRSYIMLSDDVEVRDYESMANALEGFKNKFLSGAVEGIEIKKEDCDDILPVKRARVSSSAGGAVTSAVVHSSSAAESQSCITRATAVVRQLRESLSSQSDGESEVGRRVGKIGSALPPYLLTGEPVLTTHSTDRVQHHSDKHKAEPGYTPNVSLDPAPYLELRAKYPDLVHQDDLMQTALGAFTGEVKGQMSLGADDDVFNDDEDDDAADDDEDNLDTQSVMSDKLTCTEELEHCVTDNDEAPPSLELMIQLVNSTDRQSDMQTHLQRDQESKLTLLKAAVDEGGTETNKKQQLDKFLEIQNKQRDLVGYLAKACVKDEKELGYLGRILSEKQEEMLTERRRHEEEITRLRQENATRMREAALERYRLLQQIEALANGSSNSELAVMAAQYKEEADRLRQRLTEAESSTNKLQQEINELRSAADKSTRDRRLLALGPALGPTTTGVSVAPNMGWYTPAAGTTWVVAVKQE